MNLGTLIDRAQELADRKDSDWDSRTRRWINEAITQWSIKLPWPTLRRVEDFTFQSREDTGRILTLPQRVHKVLRVADDTNNRNLLPGAQPDRDFPNKHLDNTAGASFFWRELGVAAAHNQPAAASAIDVQTATSDVYTVYMAGLAQETGASGTPDELFFVSEEISVAGSNVNSSTNLFVRIDTIGKSKEQTFGDTIVSATGTRLARLDRNAFQTIYRQIELTAAPEGGTVFQVEYLLLPQELRSANEMPSPAVDTDYLIWYSASMIQRAQGNLQESELLMARAQEILERLATQEKNAGDQDFRAFPEVQYWSDENRYIWPPN